MIRSKWIVSVAIIGGLFICGASASAETAGEPARSGCVLPVLEFERSSSRLSEDNEAKLSELARCLAENSQEKVWVWGRADVPTPYDWVLAFDRANAAVEHLVSKGIYRGRLVPAAAGYESMSDNAAVAFQVANEQRLKRATTAARR